MKLPRAVQEHQIRF